MVVLRNILPTTKNKLLNQYWNSSKKFLIFGTADPTYSFQKEIKQ